jgi:hypothetical protein
MSDDAVCPAREMIHLGDAEIADLGMPILSEKDICRLDVAVNNAVLMRFLQASRDVSGEAQHICKAECAVRRDSLAQRATGDVFQHEVTRPIGINGEIEDRHEIWVAARARACFRLTGETIFQQRKCPGSVSAMLRLSDLIATGRFNRVSNARQTTPNAPSPITSPS